MARERDVSRGMSAAEGRAAEIDWISGLKETAERKAKITERKKAEISLLEERLKELKGFGYKTPKDIPPEKLQKTAQQIYVLLLKIKAQLIALLKRDFIAETKLSKIMGRIRGKLQSIERHNQEIAKELKRKETEILVELAAIVKYWEKIAASGKFPWLSKYNKKEISWPFEIIEKQEMNLLKKIAEIR